MTTSNSNNEKESTSNAGKSFGDILLEHIPKAAKTTSLDDDKPFKPRPSRIPWSNFANGQGHSIRSEKRTMGALDMLGTPPKPRRKSFTSRGQMGQPRRYLHQEIGHPSSTVHDDRSTQQRRNPLQNFFADLFEDMGVNDPGTDVLLISDDGKRICSNSKHQQEEPSSSASNDGARGTVSSSDENLHKVPKLLGAIKVDTSIHVSSEESPRRAAEQASNTMQAIPQYARYNDSAVAGLSFDNDLQSRVRNDHHDDSSSSLKIEDGHHHIASCWQDSCQSIGVFSHQEGAKLFGADNKSPTSVMEAFGPREIPDSLLHPQDSMNMGF